MRIKMFAISSCFTALGLLLMSCAPTASPTSQGIATPTSASSEAKAAAPTPSSTTGSESPRYGGVLTSFAPANPPSLDAQQESTINTSLLVTPIYTSLVQADPLNKERWVPGLAEKWEMSKDGLTWTFDIRQGVKFHDGTPFTVDDAVFNLKRLTNPPKGVTGNLNFLLEPVVKSIEKEGNKVKVNLKYPFAVMLDTLAINYAPVYSQKYIEKHGDMKTTAMGTGPFKFKSYTPGVSFEGVKNPDFWVKGRPYLDGYRYLILKDAATQLSVFRTGKINITTREFAMSTTDMETAKKENSQLKFYPTPTLQCSWFAMNVKKAPFKDLRVRQAVSLAVDRQAALKVLAQGQGLIGKPLPSPDWGIPKDDLLKMPGYRQPKDDDISQAKKLMAAAGYADGFDLTILSRPVAIFSDAAVFMTSQLAKIGIKAKVNTVENAVFYDIVRKGGHEAYSFGAFWVMDDPEWQGRYWLPGSPINYTENDDDTELTSMWDEQIKIIDPAQRKALIRKVEEHLLQTLPFVALTTPYFYIGVRPEVKNFFPGISDSFGNTLDAIWLAK